MEEEGDDPFCPQGTLEAERFVGRVLLGSAVCSARALLLPSVCPFTFPAHKITASLEPRRVKGLLHPPFLFPCSGKQEQQMSLMAVQKGCLQAKFGQDESLSPHINGNGAPVLSPAIKKKKKSSHVAGGTTGEWPG